jgi:hypothetical protein
LQGKVVARTIQSHNYCGHTGEEKRAIKTICGSAWLTNGREEPGLLDSVYCNMPMLAFRLVGVL